MDEITAEDEQITRRLRSVKRKLCMCSCHRIGVNVMHCMPCCGATYVQYLNPDGTVNESRVWQLQRFYFKKYGIELYAPQI